MCCSGAAATAVPSVSVSSAIVAAILDSFDNHSITCGCSGAAIDYVFAGVDTTWFAVSDTGLPALRSGHCTLCAFVLNSSVSVQSGRIMSMQCDTHAARIRLGINKFMLSRCPHAMCGAKITIYLKSTKKPSASHEAPG